MMIYSTLLHHHLWYVLWYSVQGDKGHSGTGDDKDKNRYFEDENMDEKA